MRLTQRPSAHLSVPAQHMQLPSHCAARGFGMSSHNFVSEALELVQENPFTIGHAHQHSLAPDMLKASSSLIDVRRI